MLIGKSIGLVSSVGRAPDFQAGGHGLKSCIGHTSSSLVNFKKLHKTGVLGDAESCIPGRIIPKLNPLDTWFFFFPCGTTTKAKAKYNIYMWVLVAWPCQIFTPKPKYFCTCRTFNILRGSGQSFFTGSYGFYRTNFGMLNYFRKTIKPHCLLAYKLSKCDHSVEKKSFISVATNDSVSYVFCCIYNVYDKSYTFTATYSVGLPLGSREEKFQVDISQLGLGKGCAVNADTYHLWVIVPSPPFSISVFCNFFLQAQVEHSVQKHADGRQTV